MGCERREIALAERPALPSMPPRSHRRACRRTGDHRARWRRRRLLGEFAQVTTRQFFELLIGSRVGRRRWRGPAAAARQRRRTAASPRFRRRYRPSSHAPQERQVALSHATLPVKVRVPRSPIPTLSITSRSPALQALSQPDFARYAFGGSRARWPGRWSTWYSASRWEITRDPLDLGFIGLAQFLPFLALVLPGGQVADRFDRRIIIACLRPELSPARRCSCSRCRAAEVIVFVRCRLVRRGARFWAPAGQAMVPNLVPEELPSGAVSVNAVMFRSP